MKKVFALLLAMLLALTLLACGKDESKETTGAIPTTAPATVPTTTAGAMAALEGSDTKLRELSSFLLTIQMDNTAGDMRYVDEMVYSYQKNADGTPTISVENVVKMYRGEESRENVNERRWYSANVGFVSNGGSVEKKIKDEGFDLSFVVGRTPNFDIDPKNSTLIAEFAALSPVQSSANDGATLYRLENMSRENCVKVYMAMTGMSQEEANEMPPAGAFHAQATVDADGYLRQFRLDMLDVETSEGKQSMVITFTVDQLNAVQNLAKPDYAENFSLTEDATICHIQNGWDAYYKYTTKDGSMTGEQGLWFVGFGRYARDSYTVDSYRICQQLDGVKVEGIRGALYNGNSSVTVERLIVPAPMQIGGVDNSDGAETVTLFFEAPEEAVTKSFLLEDDAEDAYDPSTGMYRLRFKAAYYAGQWELTNGIPQAK